ncbi:MAG: hypothetical protein V1819_00690 [bacterium]
MKIKNILIKKGKINWIFLLLVLVAAILVGWKSVVNNRKITSIENGQEVYNSFRQFSQSLHNSQGPVITCTDSDNGKSIYERGEVDILRDGKKIEEPFKDICTHGELAEYYCCGNKYCSEITKCEKGCLDGACIGAKIILPQAGDQWVKGWGILFDKVNPVEWTSNGLEGEVSVKAVAQNIGETKPQCQEIFGAEKTEVSVGRINLAVPKDACSGKYKIQICEFNEEVFEKSMCFESDYTFDVADYFCTSSEECDACQVCKNGFCQAVNTEWGDGLYKCPSQTGGEQQRCFAGKCLGCRGLLLSDRGNLGCWYLASPGISCENFCKTKGDCADKYSEDWEDDESCTIGKKLTNCKKCLSNYENGWLVPYYNSANKTCYHYQGAGIGYSCSEKPLFDSIQRMCACNY